jgi:hypothetical protein
MTSGASRWWLRPAALVTVVAAVVALAGCQVDISVDVVLDEAGAGTVTVTARADAEVLAVAPRLGEDLELEDLKTRGWTLEGPNPTPDGGLEVVATREVDDLTGLNAALADIGPPVIDLRVERTDEFARTAWTLSGETAAITGPGAFADDGLVEALGEEPVAQDFTDRGLTIADTLDYSLSIRLPGEPVTTTGELVDGVLRWQVPVDGTTLDISAIAERTDDIARQARTVADVARFVMVVWILITVPFVIWVLMARRRRRLARRRPGTPLA